MASRCERRRVVGEVVRPWEYLDDDRPDLMRDTVFENCLVRGPAILVPGEDSQWAANTFTGDVGETLWEVEEGAPVVGAILVERCRFERCTFDGIGIAGPARLLAKFRPPG